MGKKKKKDNFVKNNNDQIQVNPRKLTSKSVRDLKKITK